MTWNPEAPLLKLLIGVIVCGAERPPPPHFLVFFWYDHQNILDYPATTVFFHLMNTSVLHAICIWNDHVFNTSDFGEMESRCSFLALQVRATLGCTCWLHFITKASCLFGIMRSFVFSLLNALSWSCCLCMKHKAIYWVVNLFFNSFSNFFFSRAALLMFAWTVLSSNITAVE